MVKGALNQQITYSCVRPSTMGVFSLDLSSLVRLLSRWAKSRLKPILISCLYPLHSAPSLSLSLSFSARASERPFTFFCRVSLAILFFFNPRLLARSLFFSSAKICTCNRQSSVKTRVRRGSRRGKQGCRFLSLSV